MRKVSKNEDLTDSDDIFSSKEYGKSGKRREKAKSTILANDILNIFIELTNPQDIIQINELKSLKASSDPKLILSKIEDILEQYNSSINRLCNQLKGHTQFLTRLVETPDLQSMFLISQQNGSLFLPETASKLALEQASRTSQLISSISDFTDTDTIIPDITDQLLSDIYTNNHISRVKNFLFNTHVSSSELSALLWQEILINDILSRIITKSKIGTFRTFASDSETINNSNSSNRQNNFDINSIRQQIKEELEQKNASKLQHMESQLRLQILNELNSDAATAESSIRNRIKSELKPQIEAKLKQQFDNEKSALERSLRVRIRNELEATLRPQIERELRRQIHKEIASDRSEYESSLRKQIKNELKPKIEAKLRPQIERECRSRILERMQPRIPNLNDTELETALRRQLRRELTPQIESELRPKIKSEVKEKMCNKHEPKLRETIRNELRPQIKRELKQRLMFEVRSELTPIIERELRPKITNELLPNIKRDVKAKLENKIRDELTPLLTNEIRADLKKELIPKITKQVKAQNEILLREEISNELRPQIANEIREEVTSKTKDELRKNIEKEITPKITQKNREIVENELKPILTRKITEKLQKSYEDKPRIDRETFELIRKAVGIDNVEYTRDNVITLCRQLANDVINIRKKINCGNTSIVKVFDGLIKQIKRLSKLLAKTKALLMSQEKKIAETQKRLNELLKWCKSLHKSFEEDKWKYDEIIHLQNSIEELINENL
ncbi:hypothetical protein GPJ56_004247 [Histomonas meleagridis]|uniref:uncharacterized protein n=1 Tax=Histomonas meleagridis TaxID=135588 RepID=UPI00355A926F|nr:hypothetical protein GPJ56_004247 [Histomonas meleagridis]KAH0800540.1 hypothetical protein GO595_006743 [Histomonas meleagridis]